MIPAPEAFKAYRQFIVYQLIPQPDGKLKKQPINPNNHFYPHNPIDPALWVDYQTAASMVDLLGPGYGIGFVFTDNDPFFFLDIDHCGPDWSPLARQLCQAFAGCAVEVSVSGTGLHVFGSGPVPPHSCEKPAVGGFYTSLRFAALTGTGLTGDAAHVPPAETVKWLVDTYFTPGALLEPADWTDGPCDGYGGPTDDLQLIDRMLASRSVSSMFGGRASVLALWTADVDALAAAYPALSDTNPYDHSSADAALCAHLAFWTGKDCERMDRLFRMSGLVRDKWTDREKYRRDTILKAVAGCRNVLGARETPAAPAPAPSPSGGTTVQLDDKTGFQFLSPSQQKEHFAGCVYVRNLHKIFVPDGDMVSPDQFKVIYGGFVFGLDDTNSKSTTDAWKAFTQSQAINFPKVKGFYFRPESSPGAVIKEPNGDYINTYIPLTTRRVTGDPAPFLAQLEKLFPNQIDREIILNYMAACIQFPGVKFQWCPLIQGIEGNGKSFLFECLAEAIGWHYAHKPKASDLSNKFNYWVLEKLIAGVEEIYVQEKEEVMESLKELITNRVIEIQGKSLNQKLGDNRANFMMFTNHKNAIRLGKKMRRYCVFYTPQQEPEDFKKWGMTGDYFPKLYEWLRADGSAIVNDFLRSHQVPEKFIRQTVMGWAPRTSSTDEAMLLSMGGLEQEILDSIEEGRYGFANGWISSCAFSDLLKSRKDEKRIPHNKRKLILEDMGYIQHPGLKEGRVNNIIPVEGGKPKLYIKKGHPDIGLIGVAAIVKAYTRAQEG